MEGKKSKRNYKNRQEMMLKVLTLLSVALLMAAVDGSTSNDTYTRNDFPPHFLFGASTSAFQVEGAANEDGRTPSIFDTYAQATNLTGGYGNIACDQYHRYKEDVEMMSNMGLNAYRFSISWSRLIPNGRGPVNPKGLEYYNNLINELISYDIEPHVTLHHSDLPQALEDEYEGWLSRRVVKDFKAYAEVCFREFGDRVKHWITMNEPNVFVAAGYDWGFTPPLRCSPSSIFNCSRGNSSTEPYKAAHHLLLAHASAATLYRQKYQEKQHGFIGINLFAFGVSPLSNTTEDFSATQRALIFNFGWFLNPIMHGDYPEIMKKNVGLRLPSFTKAESKLVKGSIDFLGINFYYTGYAKSYHRNMVQMVIGQIMTDLAFEVVGIVNGTSFTDEIPIRPWGLKNVLEYVKNSYSNIPVYIHENGQLTPRNSSLDDWPRVKYLHAYIKSVLDALRNGSNVRGYFVWSLMDLLELLGGYTATYGLYYVDLDDPDLKRYPRLSAKWYSHFLHGKSMDLDITTKLDKNATYHSAA